MSKARSSLSDVNKSNSEDGDQGSRTKNRSNSEHRTELPQPSRSQRTVSNPNQKKINAAVVAHLHKLELRNKKLEEEKASLQHQLTHLLHRISSGQFDAEALGEVGQTGVITSQNLQSTFKQILDELSFLTEQQSQVKESGMAEVIRAPKAGYEYVGKRGSLVESNSMFSLPEYSSLSDAYEDICLNQNPVDDINGSDYSSNFVEKLLVSGKNHQDKDVYREYEYSREHEIEMMRPGPSTRPIPVKYTQIGKEKTKKRQPETRRYHDIFGREILHYESDEESESDESSSQSLSIDLDSRRFMGSVQEPLAPRLKCPIASSNLASSLGSFVAKPLPQKEKPTAASNHRSISLPTSPQPTKHLRSHELTMKTQHKNLVESVLSVSKLEIAKQQDLRKSINRLYEFTPELGSTENNHLPEADAKRHGETEKGPPKVHISRRFLSVRPGGVIEFSETSSSTTQPETPGSQRILEPSTSQLDKPYSTYAQLVSRQIHFTPFTRKPRLHIYTPMRLIPRDAADSLKHTDRIKPPSSIPSGRRIISDRSDRLMRPPLRFAENLNFLMNPFRPRKICSDPEFYVIDPKNRSLLTLLLGIIKFFNVYTCIASQSHLVQQAHLVKCTITPILTTFKDLYSAEVSSSMPSESNSSTALAAIIAISGNGSTTGDIDFRHKFKRGQILRPEMHDTQTDDGEERQNAKMERSSIQTFAEDLGALTHQDFIFKLSSQLKLWHQYWCVLTSEGLFLHQAAQASTHRAKRSIPFNQVESVCRARLMTPMPVNRKLTSSTFLDPVAGKTQAAWRNGSAPVSRKFLYSSSDKQPSTKSYFELNLVNGKVYRLRGSTNQQTSQWMILIRQAMRALEAKRIVQTHGAQLIFQGWLKRIKGSSSCWVWCRLIGSYLIYSRGPINLEPIGYKLLKNSHIQVTKHIVTGRDSDSKSAKSTVGISDSNRSTFPQLLTSSSDSDSLTPELGPSHLSRTIKVWCPNRDPVHFIAPSDEEFKNWRDHLYRACYHSGETSQGQMDADQALKQIHQNWVYLVRPSHRDSLFHSVKSIDESLLGSVTQEQSEYCLRIFDHLLFLSHPQVQSVQPSANRMDVPLNVLIYSSEWQTMKHAIFKYLTRLCFECPELKDEIYLQLIKQSIMYGTGCKRIPKDAFVFPSKPKPSKRVLSLFCPRGQSEATNPSRSDSAILEAGVATVSGPEDRFKIAPQWAKSLKEVIDVYSSSSKIILPYLNPTASGKPDLWWPIIAVWECMCLLLPLFLPSEPVIHCLEILFQMFIDPNWPVHFGIDLNLVNLPRQDMSTVQPDFAVEMSHYAAFCLDTLNKTKLSGGREFGPSAMEVAGISIRNPYTHAYPFSIPVHLPYGSNYEVVSFHGGTEIRQIILQLMKTLQFAEPRTNEAVLGALYLRVNRQNHPSQQSRLLYLDPDWKILDVITIYELSVVEQKKDEDVVVRLEDVTVQFVFRIQTFAWKKLKRSIQETNPHLLNFLVHQLHAEILTNTYLIPMNGSQFVDLVTFLCRADHYDYSELQRRQEQTFSQVIRSYFPTEWLIETASDPYSFIQTKLVVLDRWAQLCKTPLDKELPSSSSKYIDAEGVRIRVETTHALLSYLRYLKNLHPARFNTSCFVAKIQNLSEVSDEQLSWIVPEENQLNILTSMEDNSFPSGSGFSMLVCVKTIPYNSVLSYGGQKYGAFFLVYLEMMTRKSDPTRVDPDPFLDRDHLGVKHHGDRGMRSLPKQELKVRKIKILLKDVNTVLELSSTLTFLINQKKESEST